MQTEVLTTMRAMAWERAKGELESILVTYYPEYDSTGEELDTGYKTADKLIKAFIKKMEYEVMS